ncbi:MAG: 50S ribosomal protein L18 [Planctomycetes bacterium]|jgi:large subunit ribosomal protein L18|nr:50S ribosomal protein L18 [Planctomycetota bacterium]HON45788.1 50S ribosomal protein L18 [Planctomycetota bacterium]HPY75100.1 50S ribosomal protein L18 [Planctomycetota bacterium]HQB00668.1 50S ribosomal protein L18 [Planctomycetota bacterium]HRU51586.1 50S ribosomal protein L18 [Planctomycetota bacterium]
MKNEKVCRRWRRHCHLRKKVEGTPSKPRLAVFRSNKNIYCQLIDDTYVDCTGSRSGKTIVACSSKTASIASQIKNGCNIKAAELVGTEIAKLAREKGIETIAFDRGGFHYHGRIKALADAARKGGLKF